MLNIHLTITKFHILFIIIALLIISILFILYKKNKKVSTFTHLSFETLLKNIKDILFFIDANGKIAYLTPSTKSLLGYDRKQISNTAFEEYVYPDDMPVLAQRFKLHLKGVQLPPFEFRIFDIDKKVKWFRTYSKAVYKNNKIIGVQGTLIDISEQRFVQNELKKSKEYFRILAEKARDVIFRFNFDPEKRFDYINPVIEKLTGYERTDFYRDPDMFLKIVHPQEREIADDLMSKQSLLYDMPLKLRLICKNEDIIWVELRSVPIYDNQGNVKAVQGIIRDMTDWKTVEKFLDQQAHELARSNSELQQFAYIASHDLKEPLRMVTNYLGLLEKRYSDKLDTDAKDFIWYALDGANRMRKLIDDLLIYSRAGRKKDSFQIIDLNEVLKNVLKNLELLISENSANIIINDLPNVKGNFNQLLQVFQNFLSNAIKFRKKDKTVNIEITVDKKAKNWLFCIKDNGIGLNENDFERIFEPFQRLHTREEYPGTGIGLAVCRKTILSHEGKIWVESNKDGGSTFFFTLPVIKENNSNENG